MNRDSRTRTPAHPSYQTHRRQVFTQILLPIIFAALIVTAITVLASLSALRGGGDVGRWAAISTIWLVIPLLVMGLILLAVLGGMIYLLGKTINLIPPYSHQAQRFVNRLGTGTRRAAGMVRSPILAVRGFGALLRDGLHRARERM